MSGWNQGHGAQGYGQGQGYAAQGYSAQAAATQQPAAAQVTLPSPRAPLPSSRRCCCRQRRGAAPALSLLLRIAAGSVGIGPPALMAGVCAQQAQQAGAFGGAQQQQQVTLPRCSLLMPTSPDHGSHVPASSLRCARSCMLAADGGLRCGVVQTAAYSGYPAATPVQGMNSAAGNQGYAATSYGTSQQGYASAQVCCARQLIRSPGRRCDGCMRARRGTSYREGVAGQEQEQCVVKRTMCRLCQCPALLPIPMPCAARRAILASDFPLRHHVDGTRSTAALRHSREPCTLEVRLRGRVMHGRPAAGA